MNNQRKLKQCGMSHCKNQNQKTCHEVKRTLPMEAEPCSDSFLPGEWYVVMGETVGKVAIRVEAVVAGNQVSGGVELLDHARPLTIALSG